MPDDKIRIFDLGRTMAVVDHFTACIMQDMPPTQSGKKTVSGDRIMDKATYIQTYIAAIRAVIRETRRRGRTVQIISDSEADLRVISECNIAIQWSRLQRDTGGQSSKTDHKPLVDQRVPRGTTVLMSQLGELQIIRRRRCK